MVTRATSTATVGHRRLLRRILGHNCRWAGQTHFGGVVEGIVVAVTQRLRVRSVRLTDAAHIFAVSSRCVTPVHVPDALLFSSARLAPATLLIQTVPGPAFLWIAAFSVQGLVSLALLLLALDGVVVTRTPPGVKLHVKLPLLARHLIVFALLFPAQSVPPPSQDLVDGRALFQCTLGYDFGTHLLHVEHESVQWLFDM